MSRSTLLTTTIPIAGALLLLMGCAGGSGGHGRESGSTAIAAEPSSRARPGGGDALESTAWRLTSLGGRPSAHGATLRFAGGRFEGQGACNAYGGAYRFRGGAFEADDLLVTQIACDGIEEERAWVEALGAARRAGVNDSLLMLIDGRGAMVAILERDQDSGARRSPE